VDNLVERFRSKLKEQKGFTLIELLAVIVILGIIAAIAVPSIGKVISNAKDKAKIEEAIQIIDAAKLAYANDSTVASWSDDGTNNALSQYISKLQDKTWTVSYDLTTNIYTIKGHESAPLVKSTYTDTTAVTEDELTAAAK
jgi:type IV pilus assembly protein PilA